MIDTHCHLDLYPNPGRVIAEADARGTYVIAVTTTPRSFLGNLRLTEGRKRIRVAIGLHPELVAERYREVDDVCRYMEQTTYVGEIGIDGSPPHAGSLALQRKAFHTIVRQADQLGGKILSIHSRGAASAVLQTIEEEGGKNKSVLHWFSGTQIELKKAIDLDCWFSVGPSMLKSKKGRDLTAAIPRKRLLIETDGPFGTDGDRPLMPWDAELAIPVIAKLWKVPATEVADTLCVNFRNLLNPKDLQVSES